MRHGPNEAWTKWGMDKLYHQQIPHPIWKWLIADRHRPRPPTHRFHNLQPHNLTDTSAVTLHMIWLHQQSPFMQQSPISSSHPSSLTPSAVTPISSPPVKYSSKKIPATPWHPATSLTPSNLPDAYEMTWHTRTAQHQKSKHLTNRKRYSNRWKTVFTGEKQYITFMQKYKKTTFQAFHNKIHKNTYST